MLRVYRNGWFGRFMRKEGISVDTLLEMSLEIDKGLIDADLGGGLIKKRIRRPGQGKSGSYRTIAAFRSGERIIFVFGFAKNTKSNLTEVELRTLRSLADEILGLSEQGMQRYVREGFLTELTDGPAAAVQKRGTGGRT